MRRRKLLRLLGATGALLALPSNGSDALDVDRLGAVENAGVGLDAATVGAYRDMNVRLWQVYARAARKQSVYPLVTEQLGVLVDGAGRAAGRWQPPMWEALADLYQLAGELHVDRNRHTEAAQCYLLAARAADQAQAYDLWSAALTRHAFVALYDRQPRSAVTMLDGALRLAARGDRGVPTRQWAAAVRAQAHAAAGEPSHCQRDLDAATETPDRLSAQVGWLRFDASRLPEQRGTCLAALGRHAAAEATLEAAVATVATPRRRAAVLADLALVGIGLGDTDRVVARLDEALTLGRATASGVIAHRLRTLAPQLRPLTADPRVRRVRAEIADLGSLTNGPTNGVRHG